MSNFEEIAINGGAGSARTPEGRVSNFEEIAINGGAGSARTPEGRA
jgi:hypothetical protein